MRYISPTEAIEKLERKCPLCSRPYERAPELTDTGYSVRCKVCGTYRITDEVLSCRILDYNSYAKPLLSAIVRRHFDLKGKPQTITSKNWQALVSQAPDRNDVPSKVRYLLSYMARKSQFPGDKITLDIEADYPICFAANADEFTFYILYANGAGFLSSPGGPIYRLTTKGWEEVRRIPTLDSPYAFVAMSLSEVSGRGALLTRAFDEAIKPAIEHDAGYQKAIRVDKVQFLGDIVFEIIARIRECRFLVADVTDHRNGVYFEAGYAMGMGLPVIWMCHEDDKDKAHFDTRNLNHIIWEDIGELRTRLANRILAIIGKGPAQRSVD